MTMTTLQQAYEWIVQDIPQARLVGDGAVVFQRTHTDSRSAQSGDLFICLIGERFDAHEFLPQLKDVGLAGVLVQAGRALPGMNAIEVPDTLQAMAALARHWRRQFDIPVLAVTGSNGKTTVTQMLAAILRAQYGDAALATTGNLNNEIGVPMMALRLRPEHRAAVLELGMNHPGEIARLAAIAQPTAALVNNAQREHLEFMHTVEAVARENGSVFSYLPLDGKAVFPGDDAYAPLWRELAANRTCVEFAGHGNPVRLRGARWSDAGWDAQIDTPKGTLNVVLQVLGRHNLRNALAAVALALAAGISPIAIIHGLNIFKPVKGRSAFHVLPSAEEQVSRYLVDDTYNANPDSVHAAIDVLADLPGPRVLVLGDMGEVGSNGTAFHAEAGEYARAKGVDEFLALGVAAQHAAEAFGVNGRHFQDQAQLLDYLQQHEWRTGSMLVKGSRFMGMESIVNAVLAQSAQTATPVQGGAA